MNKNLGKTVKDKITGYKGIATGFAQYLTGCDQYLITPKCDKEFEYPEGVWLDVNRLEFIEKVKVEVDTSKDKGSDISPPKY